MIECAKCGKSVEDGTEECPQCEHAPGPEKKKSGNVLFIVGAGISITGLGLPIGVPIAALGVVRVMKSKDMTVASE